MKETNPFILCEGFFYWVESCTTSIVAQLTREENDRKYSKVSPFTTRRRNGKSQVCLSFFLDFLLRHDQQRVRHGGTESSLAQGWKVIASKGKKKIHIERKMLGDGGTINDQKVRGRLPLFPPGFWMLSTHTQRHTTTEKTFLSLSFSLCVLWGA